MGAVEEKIRIVKEMKTLYDKLRNFEPKPKTIKTYSRADEIRKASTIEVGGSEEEAKDRVKSLMKKNTAVDYKKMSKEERRHINNQYEESKKRLEVLNDKEFEWSMEDGKALTESEKSELEYLLKTIGHTLIKDNITLDDIAVIEACVDSANQNIQYVNAVYLDEIESLFDVLKFDENVSLDYISENKLFTYSMGV